MTRPQASVVICAYTLERWSDLLAAVDSVRTQLAQDDELILVADHNAPLFERACAVWPDMQVVESLGPRGLSGARNTGIATARHSIVAFLDDDAQAAPGWLDALLAPFADGAVLASGGWADAAWDAGRPSWFPPELDWVVGCSYTGLPTHAAPIRNPLGCAMAFRRDAVLAVGGFDSRIGRVGRLPTGGEETELCLRLRAEHPDAVVMHAPAARVRHRVPRSRASLAYVARRCYQEGRSKALIARLAGSEAALSSERRYVVRVLSAGAVRGLRDVLHGDLAGLARSVVIGIGLALTTAGFAAGRLGLHALTSASGARGSMPVRPG